jgi:hypothetical protein
MGSLARDRKLSDSVGPQFSTTVDIGAKIIPNLFLGGYLGIAAGHAGGSLADACAAANQRCSSLTLRLGIEGQFHFRPDAKVNPWVGYGIGFESTSAGASGVTTNAAAAGSASAGVEFAHLMGGVDFRLVRALGVGPFFDVAINQYTQTTDSFGTPQDIQHKALHTWLTFGAKVTLFP